MVKIEDESDKVKNRTHTKQHQSKVEEDDLE